MNQKKQGKKQGVRLGRMLAFSTLSLCILLTSCGAGGGESSTAAGADSGSELVTQAFTPGTYTGEAVGFGGKLAVSVEVDAEKITSITVTENGETNGIGTTAVDILPVRMLAEQSTGVDSIAGCTVSSAAVKMAVNSALEQSGADMAALRKAPEKTAETGHETLETGVLIVGGGGSGMSAAISASQNGAKVLLVDKMNYLGGAAAISGGQVNAGTSNYQIASGETGDSAELIAADLRKGGHDLNDETLVSLYSENVGDTFDWLHDDVGVQFGKELVTAAEHSVPRIFYGEDNAPGINAAVKTKLEAMDVDVMLGVRVTELVKNEAGAVTGAKAVDERGNTYDINAEKVLLCTGGYGYNKALLPENLQSVLYYGPVSSTGDGLLMAQTLGAKTQMLEYGKIYPNGFEIGTGLGRSTISANSAAYSGSGAILVDRNGKRVANERGTQGAIRESLLSQADQTLFIVMDEAGFALFEEALVKHKYANTDEIANWLEKNGSSTPVFANADTLEGAAEAAGVDGAALQLTVTSFNEMVAAGTDTDFGRELTAGLDTTGKIYIIEQKPRFATTLGGLVINENMQVLGEDGTVIEGLYAAGEVVGGLHGDDSMPSVCVSWAFTSGKLAGAAVAVAEEEELPVAA